MYAATRRAITAILLAAGACQSTTAPSGTPPPAMPSGPSGPWASAGTPPAAAACQGARARPAFHRLSRTQYHNAVNQLLGTKLPLGDRLPADPLAFGFDNNGDLAVSAPLVQRYLDVAEAAVAAALADPDARQRLVPCSLDSDPGCPRRALAAFLPRAFRRPVTAAELDEHLAYLPLCPETRLEGLGCALTAALVDPAFLFRAELLAADSGSCSAEAPLAGDGNLSGHTLAARLSFFLRSSPPDDRLLELAAQGRLDDAQVIEAEVNRLLGDGDQSSALRPLSEALPAQWLGLDGLEATSPSPAHFPAFDEPLRSAMAGESRRFFSEILRENRSALELVRAPFTFANERLARHYGLPGEILGPELRRVDTAGTIRGGVLTQASLLTLTSSSESTSISRRGRWVLQNLLCTPLGDPPAGAEEMVPAPDPALGLTSRQSLEQRTGMPPCNGCHAILNPLGYGLEIFDAVGAVRTSDRGQPIDASGVLPSGERFSSTDELLSLIQKDPRFPLCLTEKLLVYALGRGLHGDCDKEVLRILAEEFARDGHRLKNHVVRIARSELFRSAHRGAEVAP